MVVTDYHKERTMKSVQEEGTMEFPTRWLCCTGKRSCDRISTYQSRKEEKCGPSAQERNSMVDFQSLLVTPGCGDPWS